MYKKLVFFVLLILAIFLAFGGCKKKEQIQKPGQVGIPQKEGEVVARVNEEVLTEKDLEAILPEAQKSSITLEQKKDYVRRWIENQILYQEAKKKRIDQDEDVKWRIDQAVRSIIIEGFLEKELQARVAVPEEEVKRTYQENKNMFKREQDEVRLSRILVKNIAEAGLVRVRMQGGESFDMIAKQMSLDGETKERGGDIGYVPLSNIPPPFYEAVTKLKTGEISTPIQTDYGFIVIMLTDRKEKDSIKEYEQVKEEITDSLTRTKREKELENLFEELKKVAKVETFGWAAGITSDETR
jgi:parvulin-like peptidyl-prolyl isomerase